jgi:hypothetical protein
VAGGFSTRCATFAPDGREQNVIADLPLEQQLSHRPYLHYRSGPQPQTLAGILYSGHL